MKKKINNILWQNIILLLTIIFSFFSIKNILLEKYKWHIVQKETVEGLIEIILVYLICIFCVFMIKNEKIKYGMIFLTSVFYLQNHQFLFPLLIGLLYFEILVSIGNSVRKILHFEINKNFRDYVISFGIGIISWGIVAIIMSILGIGTFIPLRIMSIVIYIISIIVYRRKAFTLYIIEKFMEAEKKEQIFVLLIWGLMLIQGAKSSSVADYDSLWYGLRPEYVLFGNKSFYDNLGYLQWVNYFPKFFELLIAPLSNLKEYSFLHSFNIILYGLLILTSYIFIESVMKNKTKALFYSFAIATVPAIVNYSTVVKPDLFSTYLIIFASYLVYISYIENKYYYFILAMAFTLLSACGKISSYLYIFLFLLGVMITIAFFNTKSKDRNFFSKIFKKDFINSWIIFIGSLFVLGGTTYRTLKITGYPLYPFTVNMWRKIGFKGIYPFNDFFGGRGAGYAEGTEFNIKFYIKHICNLLFNPDNISEYRKNNIVANWYGNISIILFVLLIILLLLNNNRKKIFDKKETCIIIQLILPIWMGMIIVSVFLFHYAQDGNYYMIPIALGIILNASLIENIMTNRKDMYYFSLFVLVIIQFIVMFVSHFSWSWGTSEMGLNVFKSSYDSEEKRIDYIKDKGYELAEKYIKYQDYPNSRLLGDAKEDQIIFRLSTGGETVKNSISMTSGIFDTEDNLIKYLDWANINYLLIRAEDVYSKDELETIVPKTKWEVFRYTFSHMKENIDLFIIETDEYILMDITPITNPALYVKDKFEIHGIEDENWKLVGAKINNSKLTEYNPWGYTAGFINMDDIGEKCVLLNPGTSLEIHNTLLYKKNIVFQIKIYPAMQNLSDGAGIDIEYLNGNNDLLKTESICIDTINDWQNVNIDMQSQNVKKIRFCCNNGTNGNADGDWVVIRMITD